MDSESTKSAIDAEVSVNIPATEIKDTNSEKSNSISTTKESHTLMETEILKSPNGNETNSEIHPINQAESQKGEPATVKIASSEELCNVTGASQSSTLMATETTAGGNTAEQQNLVSHTENAKPDCTSPLLSTNKPNEAVADAQPVQAASNIQKQIKPQPTDTGLQHKSDKISAAPFTTVVVKAEGNRPNLVGAKNYITKSSLGLLTQYDSDSDEGAEENEQATIAEEVMEVPIDANKDYRNKVIEIDSESDSDSSSDSDVEYIAKIRKEIEKRMDLEDDDDAEDDDDDESSAGKNKKRKGQNSMRVKGELGLEDLPPIQDLHITVPEEDCIVLGKIHSIVEQLLLVSALPDSTLYDLDTVLFLDKGKRVLGTVFDVLGQVADPLYCVRFNSCKDIEEKGIKVGDAVYVAPKTEHTQFVIISSLMKIRGSDASWENDIEPPPRYLDYSDDEQEREARQRVRNKDRSANKDYEDHDEATKRARDDLDETASVSSVASSTVQQTQTRYPQRGGRFNRGNAHRTPQDGHRPRYNNQPRNQQQMPHNQQQMPHNPNAGSWHSNYHRPYSYNPHMAMPPMPHMPQPMPHMPQPMPHMPQPMNPSYQQFAQYPPFTPTMAPQPYPQTMYTQNPYAMRPPQFLQYAPPPPINTQTPSPPPPGLE